MLNTTSPNPKSGERHCQIINLALILTANQRTTRPDSSIPYSPLNDPQMYLAILANPSALRIQAEIPADAIFAARSGEQIACISKYIDFTPADEVRKALDQTDLAIVEEIARSKYLTARQLFTFMVLRGFPLTMAALRSKLTRLLKHRVIQEEELQGPDKNLNIKYYKLDFKGYKLARNRGVTFTYGNCYLTYYKRSKLKILDTPHDVKRVLAANQIVLGLLQSNAKIELFAIMATVNPKAPRKFAVPVSAVVKISQSYTLAYEVIRDCPEDYERLAAKAKHFGHRKFIALPRLVICGESIDHNRRIAEFLKSLDLWGTFEALFTEDQLSIKSPLQSIYKLSDDGTPIWYRLPENEDQPTTGLVS